MSVSSSFNDDEGRALRLAQALEVLEPETGEPVLVLDKEACRLGLDDLPHLRTFVVHARGHFLVRLCDSPSVRLGEALATLHLVVELLLAGMIRHAAVQHSCLLSPLGWLGVDDEDAPSGGHCSFQGKLPSLDPVPCCSVCDPVGCRPLGQFDHGFITFFTYKYNNTS